MEEENKINEAEITLISDGGDSVYSQPQEEPVQEKRRRDFHIELVLFLILGILMGIAIKNEAAKKITIGYDDYRMKIMASDFDVNKLQNDLVKAAAEKAAQEQNDVQVEEQPNDETAPAQGENPDQNNNQQ